MNRLALVATILTLTALARGEETAVNTATVTFSEAAGPRPVWGFGAEWDPHFWRVQNTRRGCDEHAWDTLIARIQAIGVARVRMMLLPDWYEPDKVGADSAQTAAKFTWDSEPMRALYRQLDVCQRLGIRVNVTWWCAPVRRQGDGAPYWLAYPTVKDWCSAPNDPKACAENVAAGLRHLMVDRGYSCIDSFTFCNEPDWTFLNDENKVNFDYYATICRAIDEHLKAAGIRERLQLDLADDSQHKGWLKKSVAALKGVGDRYNAHTYTFSCQDADYPGRMRDWVRQCVKECGAAPFNVNELGTRHYKGAYTALDVETFERAFCVAQLAILGLNEGMTGALFWGLYDQYYYDGNNPDDGSNGGLMKTNLMAYVDEGWRLRPTGQAWTLVCHGAPREAQIFAGTSGAATIDAVATVSPKTDALHCLLVNRGASPCAVRFERLPKTAATAAFTMRTFGRAGLSAPKPCEIGGASVLDAPAESIVLISNASAGE